MFNYFIKVSGCAMRGVEAQRLSCYFQKNGGKETIIEQAEIVVFFSCSIIAYQEETTLDYLNTLIPLNKRIILLGCSPGMSHHKIKEIFHGEMLSTKDLEEIDVFFPHFEIKFNEIDLPTECHFNFPYGNTYLNDFVQYLPLHHRIKKIKPQLIVTSKGCNNACGYCSVRKALGPLKSYRWSAIINQYKKAVSKGYKIFIFNGDDTGAFEDNGKNFSDLITKMDLLPEGRKARWIIDNLHPQWFLKYYECFETLSRKKRIIDIILPLQAASDKLLSSMRRKHTINDVEKKLESIKKAAPQLTIRTHFIIGYPGETDEDITQLKLLIDKKYFSHIVLLRYFEAGNPYSENLIPKIESYKVDERITDLVSFINNRNIKCELTEENIVQQNSTSQIISEWNKIKSIL